MIILTIRTDKSEAEVGLYENQKQLQYETWQAHRELAETIHRKIQEILNNSSKSLNDIEGIACFRGPGSFTGLRIGLSVANALAYAQNNPVVARSGTQWLEVGLRDILSGQNDKTAVPEYGAAPKTTNPRK